MVSEVSFPRFWGVLWGGLFSGIFRFGDRKCCFRDIAICTYERSSKKSTFRKSHYMLMFTCTYVQKFINNISIQSKCNQALPSSVSKRRFKSYQKNLKHFVQKLFTNPIQNIYSKQVQSCTGFPVASSRLPQTGLPLQTEPSPGLHSWAP